MSLSGIDVSLFKGHSTRSASTSRASLSGTSIQKILGESRWRSESTWKKVYKKALASIEKNFQARILYNRNASLQTEDNAGVPFVLSPFRI